MIRHVILTLATLASFVISTARMAVSAVDRFIAFAISAVAEKQPREMVLAGPALAPATPGASLDASLVHSLRHEAGVCRRSADRNI